MKKKSPRLQLNIRLTPEQNELIKQKLEQMKIYMRTRNEQMKKAACKRFP